jgi:acetylornithine deacetylase/succinyl-diaminopimelate desuccinylase-like protein
MNRLHDVVGPTTDAVIAIVVARKPALDDLVAATLGINSQILPHEDERQIAQFLASPPLARTTSSRDNGAGHAPSQSCDPNPGLGTRLILIGHIDTKPVGDVGSLRQTDPLVAPRIGDAIYGSRFHRDEGAVACMLHAVVVIISTDVDPRGCRPSVACLKSFDGA